MILSRCGTETWLAAACRFGVREGIPSQHVARRFEELEDEGYEPHRAAFLTLAEVGVVDGVV